MKKVFLLSLIVFVYVENGFSQSNYRQGYIVKVSGDTLTGFIDYKGNLKNLRSSKFKNNLDDDYQEYSPEEIDVIRFNDANLYVSMETEIDGAKKKYFVEQLIDGIVDVFYYPIKNGAFFLIRDEEGGIYELKNTREEIKIGNSQYTKDKKEYAAVLKSLFQDSPETINKIDRLEYNPDSMVEIAEEYHNDVCSEYACIIYTKERLKMNIGLGFHVGLTNSSVSFHDNVNTKNLNQEFSSSQNPVFGLFVNFMDPNISERFSVQLDLIFTSGNYVVGSSNMDISYLKLPISLKYTYGVKKIKPSFWLGIAYNKWSKFSDENIVPEHLSGDAIQKRRNQYGLYTGFELATAIGSKTDVFIQGKFEYYSGRHLNTWFVPGRTVQDYAKSKTSFLTFSTGVKF